MALGADINETDGVFERQKAVIDAFRTLPDDQLVAFLIRDDYFINTLNGVVNVARRNKLIQLVTRELGRRAELNANQTSPVEKVAS